MSRIFSLGKRFCFLCPPMSDGLLIGKPCFKFEPMDELCPLAELTGMLMQRPLDAEAGP